MTMASRFATLQRSDRKGAGARGRVCPPPDGCGSERFESEAGFTLLEMIVAVTLVAMMAVGLWAVFSISVRAWSRGTEFIDTNLRNRNIIDMVRKQIASTYALIAPPDMKTGAAQNPIFQGTESGFSFVSLSSLQFQENPGLTLVTYEVSQGGDGNYSLVERESRYLVQSPDDELFSNQGKAVPIFGNLISCFFEYYDPGRDDTPAQWVKQWDAKEEGRLPTAISMRMISRDPKGNTLSRYLVVPVQATVNNIGVNAINPFGVRRAVRR
jgi:prepilin-type N-terminal cleavage/methylation domain-containing protein